MSEVDRVARELVLLFRSLRGLHRSVLHDVGVRIELPALAVLSALEERGGQRVTALAETLQLDLSSVSRQVQALEREGWLARRRDPADSRAALLDLTPAGRDVLDRVRAARVQRLARLLPGWEEPELQQFAELLRRFRTDVAAHPDEGGPLPAADRAPVLAGREG